MFSYNAGWCKRTPDKRSETIPSSRISPDPSDSLLHDGASSLQFIPLILYRVQVRWSGMAIAEAWFCVQWRIVFEVYVWIIVRLADPNMAHYKISNRVSHWCHVSKQDVQDLQQKYRPTTSKIQQYISLYSWGTFCPCVYKNHLECLVIKSFFFFIWP